MSRAVRRASNPRRASDPSSGDLIAVLTWLAANPVPAGPSAEWDRWRSRAKRLGKAAFPALLHALQLGPPDVQYTAQQVLRVLETDVWAHGYGSELSYTVRLPGKRERRISPLLHDAAPPASFADQPVSVEEDAPPYATDPYARIRDAGRAIESQRDRMRSLARIRSGAVRELLASGVPRAEIAQRLGVHPNYVNQLAKGTEGKPDLGRRGKK